MAYADQGMSRGRIWAIIVVALLHALIGYALVTGLAYRVLEKAKEELKTFDVEEPPPPPEEEPPPPPEDPQPQTEPPPMAPPPIVRTQSPPPPLPVVPESPPRPYNPTPAPVSPLPPPPVAPPPPPPPPPPPAPPRVVEAARARGSLQGLFRPDDYPAGASEAGDQGTTGVRLTIGPTGRVTACSVTSSSGSRALDNATCSVLRARARYEPARDQNNQPTTDTQTARITWRLQG